MPLTIKKTGRFLISDSELGIIESYVTVTADKKSSLQSYLGSSTWLQDGRGESFSRGFADFNPIVSGMNAYSGFKNDQTIYGNQVGTGESTLYALGAIPALKFTTGLKLFGGATALSGMIRVSKKL